MAIVPDDKDWTWVITGRCPECGFVARDHDPTTTSEIIRKHQEIWTSVLVGEIAARPDPSVPIHRDYWSPLEYGCHVRDVCRIYNERLLLMVYEDDPLYANWDQDATAIEARYSEQDAVVVDRELRAAAAALAATFDAAAEGSPAVWDRTGRRSDGASFTITTFSQYLVHDLVHHLWDIDAVP